MILQNAAVLSYNKCRCAEKSMDDLLKLDNRILAHYCDKRDSLMKLSHKVRAGYLSGYSDPEFIENLQHISLP
jgi:hypothetical protein